MPDAYGPLDGAPWSEAQWFRHMPAAMPSGVIGAAVGSPTAGELAFASSGRNVSMGNGRANVGGAGFERTGGAASVGTAAANTHASWSRRDRLVLRRSIDTHTVTPVLLQGTPAATPVAPSITRSATVFDMRLFSFLVPPNSGTTISGVVDERVWLDEGRDTSSTTGLLLEEQSASSGTVTGAGFVTIHQVTVQVPFGLPAERRLKVLGTVFLSTGTGVGANIQIVGGTQRPINTGGISGDVSTRFFDDNLTAGSRQYQLQVRATVSGGDVVWRSPNLSVEIV